MSILISFSFVRRSFSKSSQSIFFLLGVEFIYTGPTTDSVAKQIEIIDNLITKGVDAIAVAPNDPAAITPIMKKAKGKGILTMTSDT